MITQLLLASLSIGYALAGCPVPDTMPDLDPARYLGAWYQVKGVIDFQPEGTQCVRAIYSAGGKLSDITTNINLSSDFNHLT